MMYIEKLLEGVTVEWKSLGEVANINTGQKQASIIESPTNFDYINAGTSRSGYCKSSNCEGDTVTTPSRGQGGIGYVGYQTASFWLGPLCYKLKSINQSRLINKYLFYFLQSENKLLLSLKKEAGVPAVNKSDLTKLKIPVPPLEVQKEIVRILDTFTKLTAELTAELIAELTARKKQYSYYRDELLSFKEGEVEWQPLDKFAEYSKNRINFEKVDKTNYVGVDNLLQNREGKKDSSKVPTKGNLIGFRKGDILIGNIRPYLKKIWHSDRMGGTNGDVLVINITNKNITSRYLYQVLADDKFFEYNMQHVKGVKMPRGNKNKIMEYFIPVPSLEEQKRIVSILDKFDTLTASISEGLLKEIEQRKKQYEYYRDMLLTFPKDNFKS